MTLSAQRDLVMQSLALTDTSYSKSSSYSAFAGLAANASYGAEGMSVSYGINVSASDATSQSQTMAVNHAQTAVNGTGFVSLTSGRDTNLYGAEVSGGGIAAQVARNLNIVSDQDTETQSAAQTSWSFSATVGYGTASLSASYAKGDAYGNYASVTTTSGLFAGSSGYAVTVGGTTTLTAAALASSADASKNSLVTGALVTQNLTNSMNWKASYWGFSFSASNTGVSGIQPGLSQKQSGSSSGIAQATIAPGAVTILNAALQKSLTGKTPDQVIGALNRSATAQNKAANTLPGGLLQTLQNQADRSNALMAASSSTAKLVGDVSSMLKTSADRTVAALGPKEQNGTITPEEQQQLDAARLQASLWGEDGAARILVHGATQGVLAWLGGGFSLDAGLRGAGGAVFAAVLAPLLTKEAQKLLDGAGLGDPQTRAVLANLIGELAVTGIGSAFGNMGAVTAASVTINNYLTHKQMQELTDKLYEIGESCQIQLLCAERNAAATAEVLSYYSGLSVQNDNNLIQTCTSGSPADCQAAINDLTYFVQQQQAFFSSFGASQFNLPQAIGFGDAALLNALNAFNNSNNQGQNGPVIQDPKAFALRYMYEYNQYVAAFSATTSIMDAVAKVISAAPLAPELVSACATVASLSCATAVSQAVAMGDNIGKDLMQAAFGSSAQSPLTTALIAAGMSQEDAVKTMFLVNTGVVAVTLGQVGYQFASTGVANTAEEVAALNKTMADTGPNMAVSAGGPRYVASDVPVSGTTVQLTKDVTLSDGTVLPAGSLVTQVENGYKIVAADGTTSTIVTQALPGQILALGSSVPKNLTVLDLSQLSDSALDVSALRGILGPYVQGGRTADISVFAGSITDSAGDTLNYLSVSGQSWKGPGTATPIQVTIGNVDYNVLTADSGDMPAVTMPNRTNFNDAEQKFFSFLQSSGFQNQYGGQPLDIAIAVQNTSQTSIGMCPGCTTNAVTLATSNPWWIFTVYQGSTLLGKMKP